MDLIEEQAEQLHQQEELIGQLKEKIAVLKGEKKRPRFKASGMEEKVGQDEKESEAGAKKRAGSEKRSKTELLEIHEERAIAPEAIPAGSRFKGYEDYVVQGLIIRRITRVIGWNAGRHLRETRSWVSFQRLSEGSTLVQGYRAIFSREIMESFP